MKMFNYALLLLLSVNHACYATARTVRQSAPLTEAEALAAQELSVAFTIRLLKSKDLTPIVSDLYLPDFIDRYKQSQLKDLPDDGSAPDLYFIPGLDYHPRLLTQAGSEDCRRFYIAANNFVFFGVAYGLSAAVEEEKADIKPTDVYPPAVIELLGGNPNLANMILRKGNSDAIDTVVEMRDATTTLDKAAAIMRNQEAVQAFGGTKAYSKIAEVIKTDEYFKPHVKAADEELFGLPGGKRVISVVTPLLFQLIIVEDSGKYRIIWAEPFVGG